MQTKVYNELFVYGPLPGRQLNERLSTIPDNSASFHKRLSELKRWGVVQEVGERRDERARMMNIPWDVTDAMPIAPVTRRKKTPAGMCPHCGQHLPGEKQQLLAGVT
jgi:hypothetical protein